MVSLKTLLDGALSAGAPMLVLALGAGAAQAAPEQAAPAAPPPGAEQAAHGPPDYFPRAAADPAAIARGKQLYSANCAFCHGSDAHGGEVGPNLLRSPIILNDQQGEVLSAVVLNGRIEKGMPKFNMSMEHVADIAAFVHSIGTGGGESAFDEKAILVGDAKAGKAYFDGKTGDGKTGDGKTGNGRGGCRSCHSATGDLAGIGSRFGPKSLQDTLVTGGSTGMLGARLSTVRPRTVTVTLPSGSVIEGRLDSIDDFNLTMTDPAGNRRTLRRDGDIPKVDIHDPFQAHVDFMKAGRDEDIHNLTAYLATLK